MSISEYRGNIDFLGKFSFTDGYNYVVVKDGYVSVMNGTVAQPAIHFNLSPDTGIYSPDLDTIGFVTDGYERVTIDQDGYLLINTNESDEYLTLDGVISLAQVTEPTPSFGRGKVYVKDWLNGFSNHCKYAEIFVKIN